MRLKGFLGTKIQLCTVCILSSVLRLCGPVEVESEATAPDVENLKRQLKSMT